MLSMQIDNLFSYSSPYHEIKDPWLCGQHMWTLIATRRNSIWDLLTWSMRANRQGDAGGRLTRPEFSVTIWHAWHPRPSIDFGEQKLDTTSCSPFSDIEACLEFIKDDEHWWSFQGKFCIPFYRPFASNWSSKKPALPSNKRKLEVTKDPSLSYLSIYVRHF